jgi:hypothetical protein
MVLGDLANLRQVLPAGRPVFHEARRLAEENLDADFLSGTGEDVEDDSGWKWSGVSAPCSGQRGNEPGKKGSVPRVAWS